MTWLPLRTPSGTALVEHHALVSTTDQVISRKRDRRHAELLSGLADLQRAEAGG